MTDWAAFHAATAGRPTRPLFDEAWAIVGGQPGRAIELGFGDGTEAAFMSRQGWSVRAIDAEPSAAQRLLGLLDRAEGERLEIVTARLEDVELPPADFVYAGYSLPFCRPDRFVALWRRILEAIRPRGVVAGELFGDHDSWAGNPDMTFFTADEVDALLRPLDVLGLRVEDGPGDSFIGPKHWHVFHLIARSRPGT